MDSAANWDSVPLCSFTLLFWPRRVASTSVPFPVWWTDLSCPCPIKCLCPALLLPSPATFLALYFLLAHPFPWQSRGQQEALEITPDKLEVFCRANRRNGDRHSKVKVIHELFFPCRMGLPEPVGVGSLPLTAPSVLLSCFFQLPREVKAKNSNQEWNKVRIYYGKDLAGCREGGFVSKALCVLVLLIRNESKDLTMVRATDQLPVWEVRSSQMNSHSCLCCLHSRAQHFQQEHHDQWAEPVTELLLQTPQSFHQNCLCQFQLQCSADSFSEETAVLISYLSAHVPK